MKKKIVLIQDNEVILSIMDEVLQDEGFEVTSSVTALPIHKIEEIEPSVVVIDEHIKGTKKGAELIEELKNDPETEDLSAILTSTSPNLSDKAKKCKADDYIEKPFDIGHMIDVIKNNSKS